MEEKTIIKFGDKISVEEVIQTYGTIVNKPIGQNANGEEQLISIAGDTIILRVYQHDRDIKIYYYFEGILSDVFSIGKWYRGDFENSINQSTLTFGEVISVEEVIETYGKIIDKPIGKNVDGEDIFISIEESGIIVKAFEQNGYIKVSHYNAEGCLNDEFFTGKWN